MKRNILGIVCFGFSILFYGQTSNANLVDLKKELQQEKSDTARVSITSEIAKLYKKSQPDSAFYYYKQALDLATKIESKIQQVDLLIAIGKYFKKKNDFKEAITQFYKAVEIITPNRNTTELAYLYSLIGSNYVNLYAEDKAIEYFLKSLTIYEFLSDNDGIGGRYIDIGNLYYEQENFDFAIKYFSNALAIFIDLENDSGILTSYINLANATADGGDIATSLVYYEQSLKLENKNNDQYSIAIIYNNIGDCYIGLDDYQKANEYFFKSLKISTDNDYKDLIAIINLNIADVESRLKNYSKAINYAKKSLLISQQIGILEYEIENLKILAIAYEEIGNLTKAFEYLKTYQKIEDSLSTIDKAKKVQLFNALNKLEKSQYTISDLSTKNDLAKVKFESGRNFAYFLVGSMVLFGIFIILLIIQQTSKKEAYKLLEYKNSQINKRHDKIQIQRDDLRKLNKTKDQFFSIIAHDLKNPLNSINGFTELMIENNNEYEEEKRLKFLNIIKGATTKVTSLLNNLLTWANSQSGNLLFKPQKLQLIQEISDVISLLEIQAVNKEIKITNSINNDIYVSADRNMLATILRNLISNAIKFTKPNGVIHISSRVASNFVEISVKDNGIGISNIDNLFSLNIISSNIGTANEQGSGLGLILCKEFVEKHGGKIWVKSVVGEGSEFIFTLSKF
ncbi:MAG: tetratricopeptide repeat-containing sensor histidine kinase [Lutibacter sp.]|nr:tetratricopeptide repeat-containing sensor histidine kinase [Lutibacter sp.]